MNACAIVLGSGNSERMGGYDKLLTEMQGDPIIVWSLRALEQCGAIHSIVVTTSISNDEHIRVAVDESRLTKVHTYVHGGSSRSESALLGLRALTEQRPEFVVVHDGARPLATPELFRRVVDAVLAGADAVVPGVPVTDSLRTAGGGVVARDGVIAVQTPQGFSADSLRAAHAGGGEASDDATLVEASGGTVVVVEGEPANLKITRPADLDLARLELERIVAGSSHA